MHMKISLALFLFAVFWLGCAEAPTGPAVPAAPPVTGQPADGDLQWRLADRRELPEQVARADDWQPLPVDGLRGGFTDKTTWLRFHLPPETAWLLYLSNALLDDVRLYRADGRGLWQEVLRSGETLSRAQWPLDYRSPILPLPEAEVEQAFLLSLRSKNAVSVGIALMSPQAFFEKTQNEAFLIGLYFGTYVLMLLVHLFSWFISRLPDNGWYVGYLVLAMLAQSLSLGLPQQWFHLPVGLSDPLLGLSLIFILPVGTMFACRLLALQQIYPRLMRSILAFCWLVAACSTLILLSGHYGYAMLLLQPTILLLIPLLVGLACWLLWRGHRPALLFLVVFGVLYVGVLVSFLCNLGVLPAMLWIEYAASTSLLVHMGMLGLYIGQHHSNLRRERLRAQQALTEAANAYSSRLERQVVRRTSALREEIARRAILERGLREALVLEKRIRGEQREFVAMVSHEFRTPLAIIDTTTQQMARSLDAPPEKVLRRCRNIRSAVARLFALVDEYLTQDRMETGQGSFQREPMNVAQWLAEVLDDWPLERLQVELAELPGIFHGDRGLLSIALRNLLINADKHCAEGLQIRLQVQGTADSGLCLRVSNPAEEIAEDEARRLFQRYYRGRQAQRRPGAGLGLYLVRRIARLHAGDIVLERRGEEGEVRFCLTLPATTGSEIFTGSGLNEAAASPGDAAGDEQPASVGEAAAPARDGRL